MNVIVTGSSSGIGLDLCKMLISKKKNVLGIDINNSDLKSDFYKHKKIDLFSLPEENLESELISIFSKYTSLVNAAGVTLPMKDNLSEKLGVFDKTLRINLFAPYYLSEIFYQSRSSPYSPSSIVNVSSIGANLGFPENPSYCASKGGLESLTRALAYDFSRKNIRVNTVRPGYTETPMNTKSLSDPSAKEIRAKHTILKRWGQPIEIARSIYFLLSDDSSYITGTCNCVDGGWSIKGLIQ